jgi:coenzyme F420-dependent glucose-6-phosphate dehydrogenase
LAGRFADGVWTLADPRQAPTVIAAYRRGCEEAGREPGEIILQAVASWGDTDDAALESAREWKPTLVDTNYRDDIHDPAQIQASGDDVSDATFKAMAMLSADPAHHVRQLKAIRALGATAVMVMNVAGADPYGMLRGYGEFVLPELRR